MRLRSLSLLCALSLSCSLFRAPLAAQTPRFERVMRDLVGALADPERAYEAVDRLQAIGAPAIPALLAEVDPDRRAQHPRRRIFALVALGRMGSRGVRAAPDLVRFLPHLTADAARECVVALGEIGPFAGFDHGALRFAQSWRLGPSVTVARMRLVLGSRPTPKAVADALKSCPVAALQVLQRRLCPEFDDGAAVVDVFRRSARGFTPPDSSMPRDLYDEYRTHIAWQLEEAAATVVQYTDDPGVLVEAYQVLLYHRDWQVRARAARRLSDLVDRARDTDLGKHVTYALADRSASVQRALLRLVPKLAAHTLAALPDVQRLTASADARVRAAAATALEALRPVLERTLVRHAEPVRPLQRFAAYWPAVPEDVGRAAVRTLLGPESPAAVAWLRVMLAGGETTESRIRVRAAVGLIARAGDQGARSPVLRAMSERYRRQMVATVETPEECAVLAGFLAQFSVPETAETAQLLRGLDDPNALVVQRCLALLARRELDETRDAAVFAKVRAALPRQYSVRIPGVEVTGGKVTREVRAAAAWVLWTKAKTRGTRASAARVLYEWGTVAQRQAVTPFYLEGPPADLARLLRWCLEIEDDPVLVADALALAARARAPLGAIARQLRQLQRSEDPKIAALARQVHDDLSRGR